MEGYSPLTLSRDTQAAPLRLLLVTDEMEAGGTQRQISLLAREMDRRLVRTEVVFFRNSSFLVDELLQAGIATNRLLKRGRLDPVFLSRLRRLIARGAYDVLHAFSFTAELWSAVAAVAMAGPSLVTSIRGRYEEFSPLQWRLKAWTARRSCCVVANSTTGAAYAAERMAYPQERIRIVRNGVPVVRVSARDAVRSELGLSGTDIIGLFLGRLVPDKNPASLLTAMARLPSLPERFVLLLAGAGPLRGELEAMARSLALGDRARFLGERRDVADLLASADFLVLPSYREGLSNVLLEAMAAGRSVLASDIPGNREIVTDEETGLLYASGDENALAGRLSQMIADGPLRQRLAAAGRSRAIDEFSPSAMVRAMENVYAECAGQRRGPRAGVA